MSLRLPSALIHVCEHSVHGVKIEFRVQITADGKYHDEFLYGASINGTAVPKN